jgi:CTP synthase
MQIAVIEFARNKCRLMDADSGEFKPDAQHKVIDIMESQISVSKKGGTMRLGAYPCVIHPDTKMAEAYQMTTISERHRHRFEFNNRYREVMEDEGLIISGLSPDGLLVEAIELPTNDFFVGVQFHPEFLSRPNRPHPLFRDFVAQAKMKAEGQLEQSAIYK